VRRLRAGRRRARQLQVENLQGAVWRGTDVAGRGIHETDGLTLSSLESHSGFGKGCAGQDETAWPPAAAWSVAAHPVGRLRRAVDLHGVYRSRANRCFRSLAEGGGLNGYIGDVRVCSATRLDLSERWWRSALLPDISWFRDFWMWARGSTSISF
jgi:hypothetical protein